MVELRTPAEKISVIPNGVDEKRFQPAPVEEAKLKLNLPTASDILVSVGALVPSKGHDLVIRAFANVMSKHPHTRLYILGKGEQKEILEKLIADLHLGNSIF